MDCEGCVSIGHRLVEWRTRRGVAVAELAVCSGLTKQMIIEIEAGHDWVDRHHVLCSLAAGLGLDPVDLTGQPFEPHGAQHIEVRSAAWHLRRHAIHIGPRPSGILAHDRAELLAGAEAVLAAQAVGDEHALALLLPPLLEVADQSVAADGWSHGEIRVARTAAYASAAGLLRRLGYRDLAWIMLQRVGVASAGDQLVAAEEVRLLTSMGLPGAATDRAERHAASGWSVGLLCAAALAHTAAGQQRQAEELLDEAADLVDGESEAAEVAAARAGTALQFGDLGQVLELEVAAVSAAPARRADLMLLAAAAWARRSDTGRAAERLVSAEGVAPLYVRLDPLARELLHALRARVRDAGDVRRLARMADGFGLKGPVAPRDARLRGADLA